MNLLNFICGDGDIEIASKCFAKIILQIYSILFLAYQIKIEKISDMPILVNLGNSPRNKTAYPNNITPSLHLLGVNGKDAALSVC